MSTRTVMLLASAALLVAYQDVTRPTAEVNGVDADAARGGARAIQFAAGTYRIWSFVEVPVRRVTLQGHPGVTTLDGSGLPDPCTQPEADHTRSIGGRASGGRQLVADREGRITMAATVSF